MDKLRTINGRPVVNLRDGSTRALSHREAECLDELAAKAAPGTNMATLAQAAILQAAWEGPNRT